MDWTEIISIAINAIILPILAWGVAELTAYLTQKVKNETADKYIKLAGEAVNTAVKEVSQTYVSALKKSGEWTAENAQEAFRRAKITALAIMGTEAKKAVEELTEDFDAWMKAKIEAAILDQKKEG